VGSSEGRQHTGRETPRSNRRFRLQTEREAVTRPLCIHRRRPRL